MVKTPLVGSLADYDTSSDEDEENDTHERMHKSQSVLGTTTTSITSASLSSTAQRTPTSSEYKTSSDVRLLSVTVHKTEDPKPGIGLVQRKKRVYISQITENGIFDGTKVEVGDIILGINGKALQQGDGPVEIMKSIANIEIGSNFTLAVKKSTRKASRSRSTSKSTDIINNGRRAMSLSPSAQRRKKRMQLKDALHAVESTDLYKSEEPTHSKRSTRTTEHSVRTQNTIDSNETGIVVVKKISSIDEKMKSPGRFTDDSKSPSDTDHDRSSSSTHAKSLVSPRKRRSKKPKKKSDEGSTRSNTTKKKTSKVKKRSRSLGPSSHRRSIPLANSDIINDAASEQLPSKTPIPPKSPVKKNTEKRFDYENFAGDYVRVTFQKNSETEPGVTFEKIDGNFFLKSVPDGEVRRVQHMQVLAINDVSAFHTISKAMNLINRTEKEIKLVLDFSSPWESPNICSNCSPSIPSNFHSIIGNKCKTSDSSSIGPPSPTKFASPRVTSKGAKTPEPSPGNLQNSKRRIAYRKVAPNTTAEDVVGELVSVAQSESTRKVNNRAPPGRRRPPRKQRASKYQVDEFDSESDNDAG